MDLNSFKSSQKTKEKGAMRNCSQLEGAEEWQLNATCDFLSFLWGERWNPGVRTCSTNVPALSQLPSSTVSFFDWFLHQEKKKDTQYRIFMEKQLVKSEYLSQHRQQHHQC